MDGCCLRVPGIPLRVALSPLLSLAWVIAWDAIPTIRDESFVLLSVQTNHHYHCPSYYYTHSNVPKQINVSNIISISQLISSVLLTTLQGTADDDSDSDSRSVYPWPAEICMMHIVR